MSGEGEMASSMGKKGGEVEITEAVEEQKMNLGGSMWGDERARRSRLRRPRMWSLVKERKEARKLTAQAAWIIDVAFVAMVE